jgi:hypothetical protein
MPYSNSASVALDTFRVGLLCLFHCRNPSPALPCQDRIATDPWLLIFQQFMLIRQHVRRKYIHNPMICNRKNLASLLLSCFGTAA